MQNIHNQCKLIFFFIYLFLGGISTHARSMGNRHRVSYRKRHLAQQPRRKNKRLGRSSQIRRKVYPTPRRKSGFRRSKQIKPRYSSRLNYPSKAIRRKSPDQLLLSRKAQKQRGFNLTRVFSTVWLISVPLSLAYLLYRGYEGKIEFKLSDKNFDQTLTGNFLVSQGGLKLNKYITALAYYENFLHGIFGWLAGWGPYPFFCLSLVTCLVIPTLATFLLWIVYNTFIGNKKYASAPSLQNIQLDINPNIHISSPSPSLQNTYQEKNIKALVKKIEYQLKGVMKKLNKKTRGDQVVHIHTNVASAIPSAAGEKSTEAASNKDDFTENEDVKDNKLSSQELDSTDKDDELSWQEDDDSDLTDDLDEDEDDELSWQEDDDSNLTDDLDEDASNLPSMQEDELDETVITDEDDELSLQEQEIDSTDDFDEDEDDAFLFSSFSKT